MLKSNGKPAAKSTTQTASMADISNLAEQITPILLGHPKIVAELALLAAYCLIADGVQGYRPITRVERSWLVITRGARALVETIKAVGALSDQDAKAEFARLNAHVS